MITSEGKYAKSGVNNKAIFELFSRGIETARDEWVYDFDENQLTMKMKYFVEKYNSSVDHGEKDFSIKWSSSLEASFASGRKTKFDKKLISRSLKRPFSKHFYYGEKLFSHRLTQNHFDFYGSDLSKRNHVIAFSGLGMDKPFSVLGTDGLSDIQLMPNGQMTALYRFDSNGNKVDNITDWALKEFRGRYKSSKITKDDIFHYVYGVLHNPAYRKTYAQNLKREFPRIPFYEDFKAWRDWGKRLMELHIGYETVTPYALKRIERVAGKAGQKVGTAHPTDTAGHQLPEASRVVGTAHPTDVPKPRLKADKEKGIIEIDAATSLTGVPAAAWEYLLGNRSAVEWVLEQYKESKPKDPTIREQFHTYRFADYKEEVIALIGKVAAVSVETVTLVEQMADAAEPQPKS